MAYCGKCGHRNDEGAKFCGGCGAPLQPAEQPTAAPKPSEGGKTASANNWGEPDLSNLRPVSAEEIQIEQEPTPSPSQREGRMKECSAKETYSKTPLPLGGAGGRLLPGCILFLLTNILAPLFLWLWLKHRKAFWICLLTYFLVFFAFMGYIFYIMSTGHDDHHHPDNKENVSTEGMPSSAIVSNTDGEDKPQLTNDDESAADLMFDMPYSNSSMNLWFFKKLEDLDGELVAIYFTMATEEMEGYMLKKTSAAIYQCYDTDNEQPVGITLAVKNGGRQIEVTRGGKTTLFEVNEELAPKFRKLFEE